MQQTMLLTKHNVMQSQINYTKIKKTDLHVHLNGAIPSEFVRTMIREHKLPLPFGCNLDRDLQVLSPVVGYNDYFKPWSILRLLPISKPCLQSCVEAVLTRMAQESIDYVELRSTVLPIAVNNSISLTEALEWLVDALDRASAKSGVDGRLIVSFQRPIRELDTQRALLTSIRLINRRDRIVGLDLTGDEDGPIPRELSSLFQIGKHELGLGITIHAGEKGSVENIHWAVEQCGATRIGHGLAAGSSACTLDLLRENNVCLEVCLTSNLLTGFVKNIEDHPVRQIVDAKIPFVLASDNPAIHAKALSDEYQLFANYFAADDFMSKLVDNQNKFSFCIPHIK
jgi:adenosine deaminase